MQPVEEVTREGAPEGNEEKSQPKSKEDTVTLTKAEVESLRRELREARDSEREWARLAQRGKPEPEPEPEEEIDLSNVLPKDTEENEELRDAIFSDPDKWTEAVSKGPGAVERYIRAKGFLTRSEAAKMAAEISAKTARQIVDAERQKITSDNTILREFPDLAKADSELFKATAVELNKLVAMDPAAKKSPAALYAAAQTAAAKLEAKRPRKQDPPPEEDDRYDRYEDDRRRRADAQDGTRTRGRGEDDDSDLMGPEAKEICRQMGISEAEFMSSRKEVVGSRPRSRR